MVIIYFVYGLSFFVFGILILFVQTKESDLVFANKIWLLGMFAILHAIVEWIVLFKIIYPSYENILLPFKVIFLLLSYLFLFEFSRFILRKSLEDNNSKFHFIYALYAAPVIYIIGTSILFLYIILFPGLNETIAAIRYTYGFWGSLFVGIGLYFYSNSLKDVSHIQELKFYFKIAGISFLFYSFFAGLIVPEVSFFPGLYLNEQWFLKTFHIPVQVFRTLCAVAIAVSSIKVLKIFSNELTEKLNQSYQQIKEFNSNASHQLKTPLSSIKVQIDVTLKKERSILEYQEVLTSINYEINSLQSLVSNLLMLTRMRDKSIKDGFTKINLDNILLEVVGEKIIVAEKKKIHLDIQELEEITIFGNETLLSILITNLIDNAIKYTASGKSIIISLKDSTLIIQDQGIGIPEDKLNLIFDKFYRINNAKSNVSKGYGLGLAMVKKIVILHDASIQIHSKLDKGTKVLVKFNLHNLKNKS